MSFDSWEAFLNEGASPETDTLVVEGVLIARGTRVRIHPRRRADVLDVFLAGRTARVEAVYHDLEGTSQLAVTLDDDPAAEIGAAAGRFYYFHPEEIEPLTAVSSRPGTEGLDR